MRCCRKKTLICSLLLLLNHCSLTVFAEGVSGIGKLHFGETPKDGKPLVVKQPEAGEKKGKFCSELEEKFGGYCTEINGGFQLERLNKSTALMYEGFTFGCDRVSAGDVSPINTCVLAMYGDQPGEIPHYPTFRSYSECAPMAPVVEKQYKRVRNPKASSWFGSPKEQFVDKRIKVVRRVEVPRHFHTDAALGGCVASFGSDLFKSTYSMNDIAIGECGGERLALTRQARQAAEERRLKQLADEERKIRERRAIRLEHEQRKRAKQLRRREHEREEREKRAEREKREAAARREKHHSKGGRHHNRRPPSDSDSEEPVKDDHRHHRASYHDAETKQDEISEENSDENDRPAPETQNHYPGKRHKGGRRHSPPSSKGSGHNQRRRDSGQSKRKPDHASRKGGHAKRDQRASDNSGQAKRGRR
eukprot:22269_1